MTLLNNLEREVAQATRRASRLRQAILAKAFSAQLVPQNPNDEPTGILLDRIRRERSVYAMPKPSRKRKRPQLVTQ